MLRCFKWEAALHRVSLNKRLMIDEQTSNDIVALRRLHDDRPQITSLTTTNVPVIIPCNLYSLVLTNFIRQILNFPFSMRAVIKIVIVVIFDKIYFWDAP